MAVQFHFDFNNAFEEKFCSLPLFMRKRGVKGQLRLTNLRGSQIDKVKLVLRGRLFNTVGHTCEQFYAPARLQLVQNIFRLVDVQDSMSARYQCDEETFNFNFDLRDAPYQSDDSSDDEDAKTRRGTKALPCSLGIFGPICTFAAGQSSCEAEGLIKYELDASVYCGDDVLFTDSQPLRIFDCSDQSPPPLHVEHFPDEYNCKDEQRLKSSYKLGGHDLEISVQEPRPVEVLNGAKVSMAHLQILFTMRGQSSTPKPLDIRINSILKALTFVSAARMTRQPTITQSVRNPLLAAVPKWGRAYNRKLSVTNWMRGSKSGEWTAKALVWMPVSEGATPAPTFFTPYLARRYSAALRIDVKASSAKAVFNLHIPVQLVYPDTEIDAPSYETAMSTPASEEEGFVFPGATDELPIYVR